MTTEKQLKKTKADQVLDSLYGIAKTWFRASQDDMIELEDIAKPIEYYKVMLNRFRTNSTVATFLMSLLFRLKEHKADDFITESLLRYHLEELKNVSSRMSAEDAVAYLSIAAVLNTLLNKFFPN